MKPRPALSRARAFYAEELRLITGGSSPAIERAFARVPREAFLGPPPWRIGAPMSHRWVTRRRRARVTEPREVHHNVLVALDRNRNNGMPSLWYRLLEEAAPQPGERAVHVGAGTGYYTAILAELVGPRGSVLGVEISRRLGAEARRNLVPWENAAVRITDATRLDEPADLIIVSAGVARPPPRWLEMLRPGGRLVVPITGSRGHGGAFIIGRQRAGWSAAFQMPVSFSPCSGTRIAKAEQAIDESLRLRPPTRVRSARLDEHQRDESCWLHTGSVCLSLRDPGR